MISENFADYSSWQKRRSSSASEQGQKHLAPTSTRSEVEPYIEYDELARRYSLDECLVDEARLDTLS